MFSFLGYPVDNTVVYLLDAELRPVKAGEIGEIYVSGLNLADGYVNGRDPHRFLKNPLAVDTGKIELRCSNTIPLFQDLANNAYHLFRYRLFTALPNW